VPTRIATGSTTAPVVEKPHPIYWGAYAGGAQYGLADAPWNLTSATTFATHAGKRLSMLEWGQDWYDTNGTASRPTLQPFPTALLNSVVRAGYLPVISWGSDQAATPAPQPQFQLARITSGAFDSYLETWAKAAAAWGHTLYLRFDWEMNFPSAPYSELNDGNRPGDFVAMWRHVHDIFVRAGATNVKWVWCPHASTPSSQPLAQLFPGDKYVDWVGLDGYNWGSTPNVGDDGGWRTFDQIFAASLEQLAQLAPSKPVMIGEMASTERGGSKAAWITNAFATIRDDTAIGAVIWFNKSADHMDWPIESSPAARAAFAAAIAAPLFASSP
jgi:hypothetical protein